MKIKKMESNNYKNEHYETFQINVKIRNEILYINENIYKNEDHGTT